MSKYEVADKWKFRVILWMAVRRKAGSKVGRMRMAPVNSSNRASGRKSR